MVVADRTEPLAPRRGGKRRTVDVAVLGGGLAGLATAWKAQRLGAEAVVCEAAMEPGGVARSVEVDGYTFDCSGHLLHLVHPEVRGMVLDSTPRPMERTRA